MAKIEIDARKVAETIFAGVDATETATTFTAGDVVSLRSGGQSMTVEGVWDQGEKTFVEAVWFNDATGALERDTFWTAALQADN